MQITIENPQQVREHLLILVRSLSRGQVSSSNLEDYAKFNDIYATLNSILHALESGVSEEAPIGIRQQYITGHESAQVETTIWTDDSVTYKHRKRVRDVWDAGDRWGPWKDGKGE